MTPAEIDTYIARSRELFGNSKLFWTHTNSITQSEKLEVVEEYRRRFRAWNALSKEEQEQARAAYAARVPEYTQPTIDDAPRFETAEDRRARRMARLFRAACTQAGRRGLDWTLTLAEYSALRTGTSCHYCQGPMSASGSGLDRVDSAIGYVTGNVVPCCWACNTVKGTNFTADEMRRLGKAVAQIRGRWSPAKKSRAYRGQPRQPTLL